MRLEKKKSKMNRPTEIKRIVCGPIINLKNTQLLCVFGLQIRLTLNVIEDLQGPENAIGLRR